MRLQGSLYTIAVACLFGFGAVLTKLIASLANPLLILFLSLLLGGSFIALFLLVKRQTLSLVLSKSAWINILLLASLGTALPIVLLVFGLASTSAVTGGFLLQLQGPAGILFANLLLREKLTWRQGTGTLLLMLGGITVILGGTESISWQTGIWGDLLIVISALCFGHSFIPAKRLSQQIGPLQASSLRLLVGACFVMPCVFISLSPMKTLFSWYVCWIILLYSFTNFSLGYIALQEGLCRLPVWASAAILQTIPIFTTVFAILLLHTTLTLMQVIGGILAIIGGIIAVSGEAFPTKLAAVPGKNCTSPLTKTS
jgi:drug/metabolite transporter (DMT)-like permease